MGTLKINKRSSLIAAKKVIDLKIEAFKNLKKSINKNFDEAVNAIVNCQSKIILCGVGKSGIIANKISATFSSISSDSLSSDSFFPPFGMVRKTKNVSLSRANLRQPAMHFVALN